MSPASVSLSPDGSIFTSVHNQPTEMMTLWDVPHLVKLVTDVKQGDEFWTAGDKAKAFPHYCAVLVDSEASFVKDDLPRLWSRCIDYYAANGNDESGRQIIAHALSEKIALAPETPGGKKTLESYIAGRNAAARQQAKEQHDAEVARVAQFTAAELEQLSFDEILRRLGSPSEEVRSVKKPNVGLAIWKAGDDEFTVVTFAKSIDGISPTLVMTVHDRRSKAIVEEMKRKLQTLF